MINNKIKFYILGVPMNILGNWLMAVKPVNLGLDKNPARLR